MTRVLRLHIDDEVGVATEDLPQGSDVTAGVIASADIPRGHKVALNPISRGAPIKKYGQLIGIAREDIFAGDHVHTHNLAFSEIEKSQEDNSWRSAPTPAKKATFDGYLRQNGSVGTRNYVGILTTVNCSATVAKKIADHFTPQILSAWPNVDGVVAITHTTGCGSAASGDGIENLRRCLAGFAKHPNFSGILMIGLGCEANQRDVLEAKFNLVPGEHYRSFSIQEAGGTLKSIQRGIEEVHKLLDIADRATRSKQSIAHLTLGLQCGGSDAWSGLTANPSLGAAADQLIAHGGSVILAETPEIYGADHLLTARATGPGSVKKLHERIAWWEDYVARNDQSLDNNPSPGNLAGGLTTILEKSLGAIMKSGTSPLVDVLRYGETQTISGLNFMDSPGYDPCSVTGEIASGANIICFTTGRGSVFGAKPVPSLKLASNSQIAAYMDDDMDIDCGPVITEGRSVHQMGLNVFDLIVETASGRRSKSEKLGFGDLEFVPWQIGAVV